LNNKETEQQNGSNFLSCAHDGGCICKEARLVLLKENDSHDGLGELTLQQPDDNCQVRNESHIGVERPLALHAQIG
jgi:hypothetical protein